MHRERGLGRPKLELARDRENVQRRSFVFIPSLDLLRKGVL